MRMIFNGYARTLRIFFKMCISNNGNGIIYVKREAGCSAWVYLAPEGRHVYSRVIGASFQAPAGRHVRRSYYNQSEIRDEF